MNQQEFDSRMVWFLSYYEKELNETQTIQWFDALKKYEIKIFNEAISNHIQYSKSPYFPALGEIVDRCANIIYERERMQRNSELEHHNKIKNQPLLTQEQVAEFRKSIPECIRNKMKPPQGIPQKLGEIL